MQCAVCSKNGSQSCSKCYKIKYCSKECQMKDWKTHRQDCFPLKVESSEELGRYLVSTKDIKQWDLILKEKPIVSGPSDSNSPYPFEAVCLGCFAILQQPYHMCSSCKWPVCNNSTCEKISNHADYECTVFTNESVQFCLGPFIYTQVHVLRCLLLTKMNSKKWEEIMSLQSHVESRLNSLIGIMKSKECVELIWDKCKLTQFTRKQIDHVLGAIGTNCFGGEDYELNKPRSGSYLYNIASMAAHDCVPNCYRLIDEKSNYQLRASIDIPAGSLVTTFYTDIWVPTQFRQYQLTTEYFFSCTCKRCMDGTELELYFSGIKCSEMNDDNCNGYFIPTTPLDQDTQWQCTKCKVTTDNDSIQEFNSQFEQVVDAVSEKTSFGKFEMLDDIAKSYQQKVHPNHYKLLDLEYDIADVLYTLLATNALSESVIKKKNILNRLLTICYHQLEVADKIRPGFSVFRGKVLQILQYGRMVKLLHTKTSTLQVKREIKEIEEMRATALKILSIEPSEDIRAIVKSLQNDSDFLACKLALGMQC